MKYVNYINTLFRKEINLINNISIFGQNITRGSCLGGLTKDIRSNETTNVFDTTNTENCLVGIGFGLMIEGINSIYFVKQQDFLLLTLDHFRNTNNHIRQRNVSASFTVVNIVMDAGYEGVQASLNNLSDFCALAECQGYTINSAHDANIVVRSALQNPGFKIVSLSQRLFNTEIIDAEPSDKGCSKLISMYGDIGSDLTIACFNFALTYGLELKNSLKSQGFSSTLFGVAAAHEINFTDIIGSAKLTGRLLILDDSKTWNSISTKLEIEALRNNVKYVSRIIKKIGDDMLLPNEDGYPIDMNNIKRDLNIIK